MDNVTTTTIEALQNSDHKAFEKVFLTYFDKVKYLLTGLLRSGSDAEELAQDIFVKLWINRQSIDPNKTFSTYLYTIARNTAINYLKHKLVEENFKNSFNDLDVEEADSSDEILFAKEISLLVEMTVCRMPVQRRKIYQMSREKGISTNEIAEELGISKKTVENQISLALQEIKRVISAFLIFFL
ncbi:RNA polymerase sigma-70 factor [Bacteroides sp.]